jgi:hypothetical protein
MRQIVEVPAAAVTPDSGDVLRALGVPPGRDPGDAVAAMVEEALAELSAIAEPTAVVSSVEPDEFAAIYEGQGDNEVPSPLASIFPKAEALTLFALTVGAPLSSRIPELFERGRIALATTLDAAASESAERAADHLDRLVTTELAASGAVRPGSQTLRYSPGYCGWNVTGQRALFAALLPEEIGITLLDSCLMEPLKSISGVMVAGPTGIHEFVNDYDFCSQCRTKDCRARIRSLGGARE